MTSVSQQNNLPSQASNSTSASQSTLSYASTVKKAASSPPIATGSSSTPSPAVAVGGPAPVQHGKSASISPVNGKSTGSSAVPAVSAPAIAHGSSTNGGSDHSRKASVTINASNSTGYIANGGPVGGSKAGIQFGSMADSPAVSHSTPQISNPAPSAPIAIPSNPRVTSPAQSPSPIPQPSASGGRPPSGLAGQGNGVTFGSLGGDGDRHMRPASGTQNPAASNNPQAGHLRRESSQSAQGDMGNQAPAGRGGFSQGGRGRGGFNPQYQQQQSQMGYPPNNQFRNSPGQGRGGMAPPFQGQGRPLAPFPNSPHQAARSPALANSIPGTPNMNQAMPMQHPQQYNNGGYYQGMQTHQVHNPSTMQSDFNSQRGGKKKTLNRKHEKYSGSGQQRPRDSRELFGHTYTSFEPVAHEREFQGQGLNSLRVQSVKIEATAPVFVSQYAAPPPALLGRRMSSADQVMEQPHYSPSASFPPLPPPTSSGLPSIQEVKKFNLSPSCGDFDTFLTMRQNYAGYPPQPYNMQMQNGPPYGYPQMSQMGYIPGPPQSPQPGYQQPYIPGQYAPTAQPMSRNSSQISEQRPASSMGGPQTPSMTPSIVTSHTPQAKVATTPSTSFTRQPRKSAAILIKRPDGETLDVDSLKTPVSPAPSNRARTPPVIASTPTPPPKPTTPLHNRNDSAAANVKSKEQIQKEMREKVAAAAGQKDAAAEAKEAADEAAKAAELKLKEEEKAKAEAKAAEEAKAKEEADAKAAAEKAKADEEEELERQIAEMEAADAAREAKEAEIQAKRVAEKAAAAKAEESKRLAEAAENDRKLKEQEREMERLEDEKERKRAEAEGKSAAPVEKKEVAPTTPSTLASKLSNLSIGGTDSGASTPASDDSMGPPPPKTTLASEKRAKPAALNLAPLNTKPIEPPQPSAALQSLKSARFLAVMNQNLYPEGILSPNPALNNAVATKGKSFKYDKEFLLQFQKVFTEKPSVEFESQIKNLIGDTDAQSARSGSVRTPGGMGPRQNSTRGQAGFPAMGSFGALGGKTLPAGTTSEQRYAMASGSMPRPAINPMASFNRPGGAFPGGSNMSRTPSTTNMNNSMPHSPRQQSSSRRGGGSKRNDFQPGNAKAEAQAAKTMPLTAGMDLAPIKVSATGWKPRSINAGQSATGAAGPAPGASGAPGHMEPDMVQRKVKAALNKMTPEKFDKIADQVLAIAAQSKDEADGRTLRQVIQLTFEKATDEAHWASMYAKFCKRMLETMSADIKDESILDKNGNVVSGGNLFRKYLLNRCQEEFERGWKMALPDKPEGERGEEKNEEAVMLSDEYYIAAAAKRRGLGLVQFIGELYKLSMLTERIMHECVKKLVDYTGIPDEAEIESLTKLLKTIGYNLDSTEKGKPMMDVYFTRIQAMIDTPELPSRLQFMLMDIIDLRKKRWVSKEDNKGPKTLDEVKAEADAVIAQKAADNARGNQRGGGNRMQMGRGDSRNFSGGYGGNNQAPPDYQKNTVGMDDLRRLTNKGGANRQSSQGPMSFGPTSMFSSRSNSGRKMGPGGSLSRTGEDSGPSSRTGTPPQQKESTTSANAFSLLAQLGSGEEHPASPPSTNTSPVLTKSSPASAEKKESE